MPTTEVSNETPAFIFCAVAGFFSGVIAGLIIAFLIITDFGPQALDTVDKQPVRIQWLDKTWIPEKE